MHLDHLEHLEDLLFLDKHGPVHVVEILDALYFPDELDISIKYDGSLSFVAGWQGGRFFVASKSAFNKKPVLNFSDTDIYDNHWQNGGLVRKLGFLLSWLRHVIPFGRIYQGDYLWDATSLDRETEDEIRFKPNVIEYRVSSENPDYASMRGSVLGVCLHTAYDQNLNIKVGDAVVWNNDPMVWVVDPDLYVRHSDMNPIGVALYYDMRALLLMLGDVSEEARKEIYRYREELKMYVNYQIRHQSPYATLTDFITWSAGRLGDKINELKLDSAKARHQNGYTDMYNDLVSNRYAVEQFFRAYLLVRQIKHYLMDRIAGVVTGPRAYINGHPCDAEGYVVHHGEVSTKLVERHVFSHANFKSSPMEG